MMEYGKTIELPEETDHYSHPTGYNGLGVPDAGRLLGIF